MAEDDKNSFSFDNDPGKLTDKDDVDFTFSDIPVLGVEKEKKDGFSFDQMPDDGTDPSIASFEAILRESTPPEEGDEDLDELSDESRTTMDVERAKSDRKAKKKKKLLVKVAVGVGVLVVIACIGLVVLMVIAKVKARAAEEAKKLTPAQLEALKVQQQKEKIQKMVGGADELYSSGKLDEAAAKYAEILKIDANNAFALTGTGKCLEAKGNAAEAEKYYQQAIQKKETDERPFASLATIMIRKKEYPQAVEILEQGIVKYPDEKTLLIPLADTYYTLNENVKALETYKKIPKSTLQKGSLNSFGDLLKLESKEEAKKIFIYAAGKFKDLAMYISASNLASDAQDKVKILTDAVNMMKDAAQNEDDAKFLLAKAQIEAEEKDKAVTALKEINLAKLNLKYCYEFFDVLNKAGVTDLKEYTIKMLKARPDDIKLQATVHRSLMISEGPEAVLEVYSQYWTDNSNKAMANFLYAKSFGHSNAAKDYYRKTLSIDPKFYQASMELGKIAMDEKNWGDAEKAFADCSKVLKNDKNIKYLFALVRIKNGKGQKAIAEYERFLDSQGEGKSQKALAIVDLALLLPSPDLADRYLNEIKDDPKYSEDYKVKMAKRYLLFKGAKENVFDGARTGDFRQFCILDKLASGKEKEVLMMPTPKEEFPDFWKVFIARKRDFKNWEKSAELLYEKHKNDNDPTIKIITSLWLGKIKVEAAEKMLNRIPFENEALFYMILAEEYLRLKKRPNAIIRYRKAQNCGRNIYSGVVDYYSNKI